MRFPRLGAAVAILILLVALVACGGSGGGDSAKTLTLGSQTFNDHGTKDGQGKDVLDVEADSNYFGPTFVRGTAGQKMALTIENESGAQHNFSIPSQRIDMDIPAKGKATVMVTFPQSGAIRFFCKYHTGTGMNGELLAGDATPQAAP